MVDLPPLPMDDSSLDLYWKALHPGPGFERSSIGDVLDLMAEMAGSDPNAVKEVLDDGGEHGPRVVEMRDPFYHPNELISALIEELRGARADLDTLIKGLEVAGHTRWLESVLHEDWIALQDEDGFAAEVPDGIFVYRLNNAALVVLQAHKETTDG